MRITHFPSQIPSQASNVRFCDFPGVGSSGAYIQIHAELPATDTQALIQQMQSSSIAVFTGGGSTNVHLGQPNGLRTTFFYTDPNGVMDDFPSDFTLYVLDAQGTGGIDSMWEHGYSYGIAINAITNQVVYWAEDWR